ncbi:hypothetical protein D3C87_2165340 [compost metagenome]
MEVLAEDHQAVVLVAEAVASVEDLAEADSQAEVLAEAGKNKSQYSVTVLKFTIYNS